MLSIFPCTFLAIWCLPWRYVYFDLLPIFWLVVCFFIYGATWAVYKFYKFEQTNPLFKSFANIFSKSLGCLFILFMVSLAMQKLLNLFSFHLFIFLIYFSIEEKLLYRILLFSVKPQHESATGIHISPPFWTSLPSPSQPHPSGLIQSPCLSFLSRTANSHWLFVLHMVM